MTGTGSAARQTQRPTLGLIAMIVGIVGAFACTALIAGVLLGRNAFQERVDGLAEDAVAALDRAQSVADEAVTRLEAGQAEATSVRTAAETLAANPNLEAPLYEALTARLAPLAERYSEARDRYIVLRERAGDLITTVQRIDRLLSGVELPGGLIETVQSIDERLVTMDAAITDLSQQAAERAIATSTATAIAEGAGRLEAGLSEAVEVAVGVQERLVQAEARVDSVAGRIESLIGLGSWIVVALLGWVALLHVALWALGRRWRTG